MNEHPLETLYNSLKRDNYDVPETYESFARTLINDTNARRTLYNSLMRDNYDVPDNYDSFNNTLFGQYTTREANIAAGVDEESNRAQQTQQPTQRNMGTPGVVPNRFGIPTQQGMGPVADAAPHPMTPAQPLSFQERVQKSVGMAHNVGKAKADFSQRMSAIEQGNKPFSNGKAQQYNPTTGETKDVYYTTTGQAVSTPMERDVENIKNSPETKEREGKIKVREQIGDMTSEVSEALNQRGMELDDAALHNTLGDRPMGGGAMVHTFNSSTSNGRLSDERWRMLYSAKVALDRANEMMREANTKGGVHDLGASEFVRGMGKVGNPDTWDMGLTEGVESTAMMVALQKADNGEELTREEQLLLDAKAVEMATAMFYASDLSGWYKAGEVTADALPFMLEMMINPAAKVGRSAQSMLTRYALKRFGKQALKRGGEKFIKGGLRRFGGRAGIDLLGASYLTTTSSLPRVGADAISRMNGDVQFKNNEEGGIEYAGHTKGEDWWSAWSKGYLSTLTDNYSEMLGEYFAPLFKWLGKGIGRGATSLADTKFGKWLHLGGGIDKVEDFIKGVSARDAYKFISDLEENAQWHGILGEYAEEVVGGIMNAILVGDQTLDADPDTGVFNLKKNLETLQGVAVMGGFFSAMKTVGYRNPEHVARRAMKKANRAGASAFGEQWESIRSMIDGGQSDAFDDTWDGMNDSQKQAILEYTKAAYTYKGIAEGKAKRDAEGVQTQQEAAAEQSYNTGYEDANTDELRSDINMAYTDARQTLVGLIGEDAVNEIDSDPLAMQAQYDQDMTVDDNTKYAIAAYVSAKSAWDGVQQRISDDAADRADQRRAEGERMAYKGKGDMQGMLRPLTINEESKEIDPETGERIKKTVYLVNGNIAIEPNGNGLSREGTDKTIYVYDPETGDTHELDPFGGAGVLSVGDVVSMEDYLANNEQQSQAEVQQAAETAQGKVKVNTPFETPQGRKGVVQSIEGDNAIVLFADGEMEQASMPLAEVQQYADALRRKEYEARHPQQTPAEQPQQPNTATEGQAPTAEQTAPQEGGNATAEQPQVEYPRDKQGNIDYDKIGDATTFATALGEEFGEDAPATLDEIIAEETAKMKKQNAVGKARIRKRLAMLEEAKAQLTPTEEAPAEAPTETPAAEVEQPSEQITPQAGEVPDMSVDKASDARARGYRMQSGVRYDRQGATEGVVGSETEVKFTNKEKPVKGRWKVVEAGSVQPSHIGGQNNPLHFITEAQPKDRTDRVSDAESEKIAANINPKEIIDGVTAYTGAPVVNIRGEVIQGNNRATALRKMGGYAESTARYKQYLIDHAADYGLNAEDIAKMQNPVMVREVDVTDEEAIRLGQFTASDTESGGKERISADKVLGKLTDEQTASVLNIMLRGGEETDETLMQLIDRNGADVLTYLAGQGAINDTQVQSAYGRDGRMTPEAKNDLADMVTQNIFKGGADNIKKVWNEYMPVAAQKALLQAMAGDMMLPVEDRLIKEVRNAIMAVGEIKNNPFTKEAKTAEEYHKGLDMDARQADMLSRPIKERYSELEIDMAVRFLTTKQNALKAIFGEYQRYVTGTNSNLFEEAQKMNRAEAIEKTFGIKENNQQNVTGKETETLENGGGERGTELGHGERPSKGETGGAAAGEPGAGGQPQQPAVGTAQAIAAAEAEPLIKGKKWQNTGEPQRFKSGKKSDSHDVEYTLGKKKYGLTTADADTESVLLEDYGSYVAIWNAYERGQVWLSQELAAAIKAKIEFTEKSPQTAQGETPAAGQTEGTAEGEKRDYNKPLKSLAEVKKFMEEIDYNGSMSATMTTEDGRKFVKYRASGNVSPNIYFGETTPRDILQQFYLYNNIMGVNIPADIETEFEQEDADRKESKDNYWANEREKAKDILTQANIPFVDVIDSERGIRVVFTDKKNDYGNYVDYMDLSDTEQLQEDIESVRAKAESYKQPKQEPKAEKEEATEQPRAAVGEGGNKEPEESGKVEKVKNEAAPKEKIDDVGEKIGGARKDLAQKMGARINLDADTFPKMFPKFDLKKAVEQGLDPKLASAVYILRIEAQQSYKSRLKHYSKENALSAAKFWAAYAKQFLENGNTSTEFKDSRWTFTEYGKKHIEYNLALYEKVYEKFGNTLFDLDFSGYTIRPVEKNKWNHYYRRNEQGKEEEYQPAYEAVAGYSSKYYTDGELDKAIDELVNRMAESVSYKESHPYKLSHYYTPGVANSHYIGVKLGGKVVALTEKMGDKETNKYLKEHEAELQEKAKRLDEERKQSKQGGTNTKWKPELGLGGGRARVGNDYRNGKDVSAEDFRQTFGFRGVEFGNYVTQAERQRFINEAYDAMMDLAALLNVSPRALSLGGRLGFAIGARGGGNAVAHYEPDLNVINLTKSKGAGSLAHEWWHALDYYFNSMGDYRKTPATANKRAEDFNPGHRAEMANAFVSLMEKINGSDYRKRSVAFDAALNKDYYTNPTELGARAFQDYVQRRLTDKGQVNDFLSSFTPEEQRNGKAETYPYPTGKDADAIDERFDSLFGTMLEREDEQGNVMLYERVDGKAARVSAKERKLRDAIVDLLRKAGIDVVTESEEGQRVLDMANGRERQHRVYHGSGANFEAFDHTHMGEGEGAQSFGWGTYVTEVEGIGRRYARAMGQPTYQGRKYNDIRDYWNGDGDTQFVILQLLRYLEREPSRTLQEAIDFTDKVYELRIARYNGQNEDIRRRTILNSLSKDDFNTSSTLYTVEIPEDNGNNYLDWDKAVTAEQQGVIYKHLRENNITLPSATMQFFNGKSKEWTSGNELYYFLTTQLGSPQKASEFLHSAGFVGIKYPADYYNGGRADNAKNYVIFNESDLQITDKVKFFRTESGEAYGFTMGGKIYLDPKIATAETPIHEYTHLWAEALRQANPKAWGQLKSELEKDKDLMAYVQRLYPELKGDELMDEVFAHFSGRRGAERLRAEQERMEGETRSIVGKAKVIAMFENLRNALKKFWNAARELFAGKTRGIKSMSAEDFADMVLGDLVGGFKPDRGDRVDRSDRERDAEYMEAVNRGDMETAQRLVDEAAREAGYTEHAYHGTGRADRVGNVFRPERATSGPMAFFTTDREIAENYSRNKADTSLDYDGIDYNSYKEQFRTQNNGKDYRIYDVWSFIPRAVQSEIEERAKHVRIDFDGDGDVIYDPEATDGNGAMNSHIKDYRGNVIRALVFNWLESGNLWNREGDFIKVLEQTGVTEALKNLGFETPRYIDPEQRDEAVYDVYLKVSNPFDVVNMVNEKFIKGFEKFAAKHEDEYTKESMSSDGWDKYDVTASDFASKMREDLKEGRTYAWTSIPDVMTAYLKSLGYDGIKDAGGKYSDAEHTVWIPFSSEQIKRTDPVTYDDAGNVIPLSERFNSGNADIRYEKVGDNVRFRGEEEPVFYSNAMRAVENIKQERATPEQWVKMIEKNGGLKAGEDKWIGLSEWLKGSDAKTLTKGEVLDYIRANEIQIEEVSYSESAPINDTDRNYIEISEVPSHMRDGMIKLNNELNSLVEEELENNPEYTQFKARTAAFKQMTEKYGDKFGKAFVLHGGNLSVRSAEQIKNAANILGIKGVDYDRPINSTRLEYTTEGLDNKREIVLTVPTIEPWNEHDEIHFGEAGGGRAVAWMRFGETTDADGKRVLVIDEIQSKRHQEGRERGYKSDYEKASEEFGKANRAFFEALRPYTKKWDNEEISDAEYSRIMNEELGDLKRDMEAKKSKLDKFAAEYKVIPDAPFDKNWHEVAMKRMLRFAAENGYDKVAWTKGEQQAERYNLSSVVSKIEISLDYRSTEERPLYEVFTYNSANNIIDGASGMMNTERLGETFGKELAVKLAAEANKKNGEQATLSGEGLKVGGEGMKGFYDQILPRFMDKYGKKWGVKTGEVELPNIGENGLTMWSVDVTDDMRESVMRGQPLFRKSTELFEQYPTWLSGQTTSTGQHTTQITSTVKTYQRIGDWMQSQGMEGAKVLDASSGLGAGTQALRDMGFDVEDVEPYPSENREAPTYTRYEDVNGKYDVVISNAVLNVIPDDWRADVLRSMADKVKEGGKLIINVRDAKSIESQKQKIELDSPSEILVTDSKGNIRAYQKGFTKSELKAYVESELGEGWQVEIANEGNSGVKSGTAVVVTRGEGAEVPNYRKPADMMREGGEEANAGEWYDRNSVERIGSFAGYSPKRIAAMNARQEQTARNKFRDAAEKLHLGDRITFVDTIDEIEGIGEEQRREWRRKKGWYSPRTGKIVIILGNHKSMDDVMKSILHEGVAHHGLRQMFGEHFNTFLDNVYQTASPEIRDRINTMAKKHGWDFREATEEYLAMLAEDTDFERPENQSWWKQVKAWFIDMLHKIGFKLHDAYDTITDNELRYILWRSYENLVHPGRYNSVVEEAKDIAKQYDLKVGQFAEDIEWEVAPDNKRLYNRKLKQYIKEYTEKGMSKKEARHLYDNMRQQMAKYKSWEDEYAYAMAVRDAAKVFLDGRKEEATSKEIDTETEIETKTAAEIIEKIQQTYPDMVFFVKRGNSYLVQGEGAKAESAKAQTNNEPINGSELYNYQANLFRQGISSLVIDPAADGVAEDAAEYAQRDAEYMEAVNSGDMEKAQRMVNEAAKRAMPNSKYIQDGTFYPMWHFTDKEFTSFLPGTSKDPNGIRGIYFAPSNKGNISSRFGKGKPYFLNVTNPIVPAAKGRGEELADRLIKMQEGVTDRNKIAEINKRFVEETGVDGVIDALNGWCTMLDPSQIKSADPVTYDDNGNVIPLSQRFNEGDNDIRFRDGEDEETGAPKPQARGAYERMVSNGWNQWKEAQQDSMLSLKKLYQAVSQAYKGSTKGVYRIEDEKGYENAYLAENRMHSMSEAQIHAYQQDYMKPLQRAIHALTGGKREAYETLTDYMMAKHGLERNEVMAKREAKKAWEEKYKSEQGNPNYTATKNAVFANIDAGVDDLYLEYRKQDYAGLTALTGIEDVEEAEKEAQRMVDEYEQQHDTTDLWIATNKATRRSLFKMLESGLLSPQRHAEIRDMYQYYIPLQGFDSDVAEDVYAYMGSDGTRLYGTTIRAAKGRKSKADDPIATIAMNGEAAIRRGNRNLMKQHFLRFVQSHPSDLVSINDVWLRKNANGEWEQYFDADLKETDTPEEVARKVRDFNERMEQEAAANPDLYKRSRELPNVPFRVLNVRDMEQHQVMVQVDGKNYMLTINGNPRAAQALNGLTNPDVFTEGAFGTILNATESVVRTLSQFYTTRNPNFVLSNFLRDAVYTNSMVLAKESPNYALNFHKNFLLLPNERMGVLFASWENGKLREKLANGTASNMEKMFYDFMMNGGETGWTSLRDIEKHKRDLQKALKREGNIAASALNKLGDFFDITNRMIENHARFTAYVTSIEMGRSVERAVWDAKEISVNFNKKGAGDKFLKAKNQTFVGKVGAFVSGLGRRNYAFWNASLQGLNNIARIGKRNPAKFMAVATTLMGLGVAIPLLNALLGGDDDDDKNAYWNLPEYVRRSNICFRFTKDMPWITIPLPIEFRAIYGLGELGSGVALGKEHYSNSELTKQVAAQFSQVLPLDFMEGGGGWHCLYPTYIKPVIEAYSNQSWTGLPIYRKNTYGQYDVAPEWQRAYSNTNNQIMAATKWLNEATGGDEVQGGNIDFNPARIEYMLRGYLGGYFTVADQVIKMGETATGNREFEWRNMMLANRVVKEGDERTEARKLTNEYFNLKEEYDKTDKSLKAYKKKQDEGTLSVVGQAHYIALMNDSEEYGRYLVFGTYKPLFDAYYKQIKEANAAGDSEEAKRLERGQNELRREMVNIIHDMDNGGTFDRKKVATGINENLKKMQNDKLWDAQDKAINKSIEADNALNPTDNVEE